MSKFLKFIVHLVVICTILCVVALAIPPFYGVTTEIRDDETTVSNLPMGSVTYAIPAKTQEVPLGTSVLVRDKDGVYKYNLVSVDSENGTGTVIDPADPNGQLINVSIGEYVPKVFITVWFIGYLMVATKSIEGLVILGLAVLFLIILYVIAELWKKDPDDDEDYLEDTEPGYVKSKKELKREERRRERRYRDEEREIKAENKRKKKEKKKIRTGGFVDEIDEDDDDLEDDYYDETPVSRVQSATSEAHELLKKEVAAATADDVRPAKPTRKAVEKTQRVVVDKKKVSVPDDDFLEEEPEVKAPVKKKMARPLYTPAQLAAMAQKDGDAPDIVKDDITKVTLFDYSDIIAGDDDDDLDEE